MKKFGFKNLAQKIRPKNYGPIIQATATRATTRNGEEKGDQMVQCRDATAGVIESPGRPQEHSAPCVISPVPPGLGESAVLFRLGEQDRPELQIPLERPLNLETLQRLASRRDRAALIERALELVGVP